MSAAIATVHEETRQEFSDDVPPPTENGRVPAELVAAIRAESSSLRPRLLLVIGLWIGYLLAMPALLARFGWPAFAAVPTAGVFVLSWLGYYRHELWHNYFAGLDNPKWFDIVSYIVFSDPAVYRIAHPVHHKYVHTTADIEFFCENYETDRPARRRQFVLELIFGNMAWELTCLHRLFREGKYTRWGSRTCLLRRASLLLVLVSISRWITPGSALAFAGCYFGTLWAGSLVTRHNQWLEHLGICANGASIAERNLLTRNLKSEGVLARWFNFMNHDDARDHVFHHTEPQLNTRAFPGLMLPPGARTITIGQYLSILSQHYRSL